MNRIHIFLLTLIFAPLYTYAQATGLVPCTGISCQTCDVLKLIQNLINTAIMFATFLATISIAWSGFKMVTEGKDNAMIRTFFRQKMKNIIIGFTLMLAAWVIVDMVMKTFLSDDLNKAIGGWNVIQCVAQPSPTGGKISLGGTSEGSGTQSTSGGTTPTVVPNSTGGSGTLNSSAATNIKTKFGELISTACEGSSMGKTLCENSVAAIITIESGGNPLATSQYANGIMQIKPELGGRTCALSDTSCIQNQIRTGTLMLNKSYAQNDFNSALMAAEYNGGTAATKQSSCCSTGFAYQCDFDCGSKVAHSYSCERTPQQSPCVKNTGFLETRNYIKKFCAIVPDAKGCSQSGATTTTAPTTSTAASSDSKLTEAEAKTRITGAGIEIASSGNCYDPSNRSCTGLAGILNSTVTRMVDLAKRCTGCNIIMTAGTEIGHKNTCHIEGRCVDIKCKGGCTVQQINNVAAAAALGDGKVEYEVLTQARKDGLVREGVTATIKVIDWASGEHFSLYKK